MMRSRRSSRCARMKVETTNTIASAASGWIRGSTICSATSIPLLGGYSTPHGIAAGGVLGLAGKELMADPAHHCVEMRQREFLHRFDFRFDRAGIAWHLAGKI